MPEYKLTYFNSRGRAEITRYLFVLADQKFEDVRVNSEEWGKMKAGKLSTVRRKESKGIVLTAKFSGFVLYYSNVCCMKLIAYICVCWWQSQS